MKIDLPIQEYFGWRVVQAEIVDIGAWLWPGSFATDEFMPWAALAIAFAGIFLLLKDGVVGYIGFLLAAIGCAAALYGPEVFFWWAR